MDNFSYISNAEPSYVEALYQQFKSDPSSVDPEWKKFFEGFDFAVSHLTENGFQHNGNQAQLPATENGNIVSGDGGQGSVPGVKQDSDTVAKEFQVARLITSYRYK